MAFGDYTIDPMANYESPMYGPYPDYGPPDAVNPMATWTGAWSTGASQGYTPMGALLLGDNVYNLAVAVMHWIRMVRPIE